MTEHGGATQAASQRPPQRAGPRSTPRRSPPVAVKDILWWLYLYPLRGTAHVLPPGLVLSLTPVLAPVFQLLTTRRKAVVRERMAVAFGSDPDAPHVRRAARGFVRSAVRRALDDLVANRLVMREGGLAGGTVRGMGHLEDALAPGRGAIVVSGHFYANRVAKRHLAEIGYSMMSTRHSSPPDRLMGRLGQRRLQPRYIEFLRGVVRDEISPTDPDCGLRILERLRADGLVNIHLDAAFSRKTVSLPFLGRPRRFATGFLDIARLTGAAMIPMACLGNGSSLRIEFGEPIVPERSVDAAAFVGAHLPPLVSGLEAQVLAHPEEWELWARI